MLADYYITAVHYSLNYKGNEVIHSAKVGKNNKNDNTFQNPTIWARQEIINAIDNNHLLFKTLYKKSNGSYKIGDEVMTYVVGNVKYIKTEGNNKECDNLGEIEEF